MEFNENINLLAKAILAILIIIIVYSALLINIKTINENIKMKKYIINTDNLYIFEKCVQFRGRFYCDGGDL